MKKNLPSIIGIAVTVIALAIFVWAFWLGSLTADRRWLLSILFALFSGIAAMCFSGSLNVKSGGITATGSFAVWVLFSWLYPAPSGNQPVFVQLARADNGSVGGNFTIRYRRPQASVGPATGSDGSATISDLPSGHEVLEVVELLHSQLQIAGTKANGYWSFPIDAQRQVTIPVADKYKPLDVPTKESVLNELTKAGISKDNVLHVELTDAEKRETILTVKNNGGRNFSLWAYDCWWCYTQPAAGSPLRSSFMDLVRFRDVQPVAEFKEFASLESTSGYFALFIDYDENGEPRRQPLGVHNLFRPKNRELVIGASSNPREPFSYSFNP